MTFQNRWKKILTFMLSLGAILFFVSCDNGGGGDSSPSLTYTGSQSKALIDEYSAVDLATESSQAGLRGTTFPGLSLSTPAWGYDSSHTFSLYNLSLSLRSAVISLGEHSPVVIEPDRSVASEKVSIDGECGGKLTGEFFTDDTTGEYWGDISFQGYCVGGVTINGDITFSGSMNIDSGEIVSMFYHIDYLSCSDDYGAFNMAGTLSMSSRTSSASIRMDMYIQNGYSGDVFWLRDYQITVTEDALEVSMNISGRFYHPDYGYVTLSTEQAIIAEASDMFPVSGVLIVVGETGLEGGPTKAKLTFSGSDSFSVEADTNGNGVFDWDSGELFWNEI